MAERAIFLDRDGTMAKDVPYCRRPEDFKLFPNTARAVKLLNESGFKVVVITNQSGITRGYFTRETLSLIHQKLESELAREGAMVDGIYYCPHHPDDNCDCRKPKTGLVSQAVREHDLDTERSFVIGDLQMDIDLAKAVGARSILIGNSPLADGENAAPDAIAADLLEAARIILNWQDISETQAQRQAVFGVSVIIPTRNRHQALKNCLESIIASGSSYKEILVVDSSDEPVREKNEELTKGLGAKYSYEGRKRLAVARNTGIRMSRGDIVVFADDDFIVDKDWLNKLIQNYSDPEVISCSGRMRPYHENSASRLFEKYQDFDLGEEKHIFTGKDISLLKLLGLITEIGNKALGSKTPLPWAAGAGFCSFRKKIFNEIGFFDEDLGRGNFSTGEDTDMMYRILKKTGYKIVYEPEAIVYHDHPYTLEAISRFAYNYGSILPVFYKKYRTDIYMLLCFLGAMLLRFTTLVKSILVRDHKLRKIMLADFRGFLSGLRGGK